MTEDKKRSFLQETAFEEDVNLDDKPKSNDITKKDDLLRRLWSKKAED